MKFVMIVMSDVSKTAEVAEAFDKVWTTPHSGIEMLAGYVCQGGFPFPGVPANTVVTIQIIEAEANEAIAEVQWPVALAGASIHCVPLLELPLPGASEIEKRMRG